MNAPAKASSWLVPQDEIEHIAPAALSQAPDSWPTTLTIDALMLSPLNVRTDARDIEATGALEGSILAKGIILPLVVHPVAGDTRFGVIAGGRRYRSVRRLVDRGALPADFVIPVVVRDLPDAELLELSTAENLLRRDLREYEVFAAVRRAFDAGEDVARIAEALGQEVKWVRQHLRLGSLARPIFDAYAAEALTLDQAQAYGATEGHALQLAAFEALSPLPAYQREARHIRAQLRVGDQQLARLLRFVGEDKYRNAGGRYELDLFADVAETRGIVLDENLLRNLADDALAGVRREARARAGRVIRFAIQPPCNDYGTDLSLELHPDTPADAETLLRATADIFATIEILDTGEASVRWWWASKAAKAGTAKKASVKLSTTATAKPVDDTIATLGPALAQLGEGVAINASYDHGPQQKANAALREDQGLSEAGVQALRSVRRAILQGALVRNANEHGTIGRDYLVWALVRDQLGRDKYGHRGHQNTGLRGMQEPDRDPEGTRDHVAATEASKLWGDAAYELGKQSFVTGPDLVEAFADFHASGAHMKNLAAAFVAGVALERSLAADGYSLAIHDAIADWCGLHDDRAVRELWRPTEAMIALLPKTEQLVIAEPFVENATFATWSRLKVAEITANVLAVVTGAGTSVRRSTAAAATTWVHPLLRFKPLARRRVDASDAVLEAAE